MATNINTYCPGFEFSDADHPITKNEYVIMVNEIQEELNQLHSTNTITVDGDSATEGGFQIKDSRWPIEYYKTMRHRFHEMHRDGVWTSHPRCVKSEWLEDQTALPCFYHETTFKEKYQFEENDIYSCSPYIEWNRLTEKQLFRKKQRIEKMKEKLVIFNEKEHKKMRHTTYLKAFRGAPAWTIPELNIFRNVFLKHGILTSKGPKKIT